MLLGLNKFITTLSRPVLVRGERGTGKELIALPGVRQTRTFFVMKEVKDSAPLPF